MLEFSAGRFDQRRDRAFACGGTQFVRQGHGDTPAHERRARAEAILALDADLHRAVPRELPAERPNRFLQPRAFALALRGRFLGGTPRLRFFGRVGGDDAPAGLGFPGHRYPV